MAHAERNYLSRREGLGALLGALGIAAATGCARGPLRPSAPLALSVSTVLGTAPPGRRTGDLARRGGMGSSTPSRIQATVVVAEGCVAPGDGGGGVFHWVAGIGRDDGGIIVVPDDQPKNAGYWKRIHSGFIDVRWFGALPGDSSARTKATNVIAFGNAIAAAAAAQGGIVFVPAGVFYIDSPIRIEAPTSGVSRSRITMRGVGRGSLQVGTASSIVQTSNVTAIAIQGESQIGGVTLEDLGIYLSHPGPPQENAYGVHLRNAKDCTIRNVVVGPFSPQAAGFSVGICLEVASPGVDAICNVIEDSHVVNNATNVQLRTGEVNALEMRKVTFGGGRSRYGVTAIDCNSLVIAGGDCEGVQECAIVVDARGGRLGVGCLISGVHFESNRRADISLGATATVGGISVSGCLFSGGGVSEYPLKAFHVNGLAFTGNAVSGYSVNDIFTTPNCSNIFACGNDNIPNRCGGA